MNNDRVMKVVDENGQEKEMFILFTTNLEETGKNYIFYMDPTNKDGQVYVSSYNENSQLFPIESDEEWAQLEEVFNEFIQEANEQSCNGNCDNCEEECIDKE